MRDHPNSWVAVSTCSGGITGVIFDGKEMHYIENPLDGNEHGSQDELHYVYKHSDLAAHNKSCGYGDDAYEHNHITAHQDRISRVSLRNSPT